MLQPRRNKAVLDGDVNVPLQRLEEKIVPRIDAEKGDLNQREAVLTRQICYTVHPRKHAGNHTIDKGKKPTTTTHHASGSPVPG